MKYTEEQTAIAEYTGNRMLVSSLAGTGKTETVAYRITKLLEHDKSVLCLTFTNAAANQLRNRLQKKGLLEKVQISTIDSYTSNLLKPYGIKVSDCSTVIRSVFQSYGLKTSTTDLNNFQRLSSFNYFQKSETEVVIPGISPNTVIELFEVYDKKKRDLGLIDFADATILATEFVKQKIDTFGYDEIIVDEAQDQNPLQATFMETLAQNSDLVYVGDRNQTIYGFAGVSADLFDKACEGWDELFLSKSFRSASNVIDAVNLTLNHMGSKELTAVKEGGNVSIGNLDEEADNFVLERINDKPAVLGQTKHDLIPMANRFEVKGFKIWRSWLDSKDDIDNFDIVFTSVHKAKGLEWKSVVVKNIPEFGFRGVDGERLLYVALSRAEENLFLQRVGEKFPTILDGVEK